MWYRKICAVGISLAVISLNFACEHSSETASRDTLTADVGKYPAGPSGVNRPRVGVPPFKVTTSGGTFGGSDLNDLAADQMTTLLDQTDRFSVIERAQLQKLIDEQNLEGIVKSGELARQGQVRGVDYLLIGKVTDLRVKKETKGHSFDLAQLGPIGGAGVNNKSVNIKTECGVDIRLVNPTTGELLVSNFSEFSRTDSAGSMGLSILGTSAQSDADINLSEDDKGKILRLALNDALRKSLPKIDRFLRNQPAAPTAADTPAAAPAPPAASTPSPAAAVPDAPTAPPAAPTPPPAAVAGMKYCPNCGTPNALDAKFCGKCGHKLD